MWLRCIAAPVGHALVGPAGDDDAAQILIADQREIRRVDDRAELCLSQESWSFPSAGPPSPVAPWHRAQKTLIGLQAMVGIAWQAWPDKAEDSVPQEGSAFPHCCTMPVRQALRPAYRSTCRLRSCANGGHQLARQRRLQSCCADEFPRLHRNIHRIGKRDGGAVPAVLAMAGCAVLLVERGKVEHLLRAARPRAQVRDCPGAWLAADASHAGRSTAAERKVRSVFEMRAVRDLIDHGSFSVGCRSAV